MVLLTISPNNEITRNSAQVLKDISLHAINLIKSSNLSDRVKNLLLKYCSDAYVHPVIRLTFEEVLIRVMDYINLLSEYLPQEQICIVIEHNNSPYIYFTNYSFILIFIPEFESYIPKNFRYFYDVKTINMYESEFIKGKFYHHEYNYNTNC